MQALSAPVRPPGCHSPTPARGRGEHRPRSASARHLCPELPRPRAGPTRGQLDHLGQPGPLGHLGPAVVEVDPGRAPSTPCPGGHRHNGAGSRDAVECPRASTGRAAPRPDRETTPRAARVTHRPRAGTLPLAGVCPRTRCPPACRPATGRPRAVEQGPGRRELPASAAPVPAPRQRPRPRVGGPQRPRTTTASTGPPLTYPCPELARPAGSSTTSASRATSATHAGNSTTSATARPARPPRAQLDHLGHDRLGHDRSGTSATAARATSGTGTSATRPGQAHSGRPSPRSTTGKLDHLDHLGPPRAARPQQATSGHLVQHDHLGSPKRPLPPRVQPRPWCPRQRTGCPCRPSAPPYGHRGHPAATHLPRTRPPRPLDHGHLGQARPGPARPRAARPPRPRPPRAGPASSATARPARPRPGPLGPDTSATGTSGHLRQPGPPLGSTPPRPRQATRGVVMAEL